MNTVRFRHSVIREDAELLRDVCREVVRAAMEKRRPDEDKDTFDRVIEYMVRHAVYFCVTSDPNDPRPCGMPMHEDESLGYGVAYEATRES